MPQSAATHKLISMAKTLGLLIALVGLGIAFFAPAVSNNTFWHSGDYQYLERAIASDSDWASVFKPRTGFDYQPLVDTVFLAEFRAFGLNAWYYYLFNILLHGINAFMVFAIVNTLLRHQWIAILSAMLFVFAVGNYGKAVMVVSGVSDLMITFMTLLTLWFYFTNELHKSGRVLSPWFLACAVAFAASLLTKGTSFSILGCMLAFNIFFKEQTGRRIFHKSFLLLTVFAAAVVIGKHLWLPESTTGTQAEWLGFESLRILAGYLVRMLFPIHVSNIVQDSGPVVEFIYRLATQIRVLIFMVILSYSFFGVIFGNRVIRLFIAWTYITVAPFCFLEFPADWLNIRYLYLVSVGFVMLLASGTYLASRLLKDHPFKRLIPYVLPLAFVLASNFIISHLDKNYERLAQAPHMQSVKESFLEKYWAAYPERRP